MRFSTKSTLIKTGFYRTNYPAERLKKLGEARYKLSTEDKIGLVGDSAALAQSGDAARAGFLSLIELFQDEENYLYGLADTPLVTATILIILQCLAADSTGVR